MSAAPRELVARLEASPSLPTGAGERFSGYGVMGLPFRSGHVLAMRRFTATSVGPGYASVWHRSPAGEWSLYTDAPLRQACPRYFGAAAARAVETEVRVVWVGPSRLEVAIPSLPLEWEVVVRSTSATRGMNAVARLLPVAAWRSPTVLAIMGALAGPLLGTGRLGLQGHVPNGQRFIANPQTVWAIGESRAVLAREDLGAPGPVRPQARLGDFRIPQRGMFAIGTALFEAFDPARHSAATSCPADRHGA